MFLLLLGCTDDGGTLVVVVSLPPVSLSSVEPASGPTAGGTITTIRGDGFTTGIAVLFDWIPAQYITVVSPQTLTCMTPPGASGFVDVTVVTADSGQDTLANGFAYIRAPDIQSVTPAQGSALGGTFVTITGAGFQPAPLVAFGATLATNVTFVDATTITCTTPAHAQGTVDISVSNADSQSDVHAACFTFLGAPSVTGVTPNSGPITGSTSVTVTGARFESGASVSFGGGAASSVVFVDPLTCTTPAHAAGIVSVTVTNPDTQAGVLAAGFTFVSPPPQITQITPNTGSVAGGQTVTVTGTGFLDGATVTIGGAGCSNYDYGGLSTQILCDTPAGSAGAADVTVTNTDSQWNTLAGGFTYLDVLSISFVSPTQAPTGGGIPVTVSGGYFVTGCEVLFGGRPASSVSIVSSSQMTCILPWGVAGTVDVAVNHPTAGTATLTNGFTYTQNYVIHNTGGSYITCGTSTTMDGFSACTLEGWCKMSTAPTYNALINRAVPAGASVYSLSFYFQLGQFSLFFPSQVYYYSEYRFPLNTWIHYANVWDGSQMRRYFNGVLDNTQSCSGTVVSNASAVTYAPPSSFDGFADEIRISRTARYTSNFAPPATLTTDSQTALLLHMNEGSGAATADASSNGNDGAMVNAPVWTAGEVQVTPSVSGVSPSTGPSSGGTALTIRGTNFLAGCVVKIGATYAREIVISDSRTITCKTPAGTGGSTVVVEVVNPANISAQFPSGFTYTSTPALTIRSVEPASAPEGGGRTVTVNGTNFAAGAEVTFGGRPASNVAVLSAHQLTCAVPWASSTGSVDVVVGIPGAGSVTLTNGFTYAANSVLEFDGSNDYTDCGRAPTVMDSFTECTMELWVKPRVSVLNSAVLERNGGGYPWNVRIWSLRPRFYLLSSTLQANTLCTTGQWMHIAAVYTGSVKRIYIDGRLDSWQTNSGRVMTGDNSRTYIGAELASATTYYNGWVDEVRVSRVARYLSDFAPPASLDTDEKTVLHVAMNEGSGATAGDASVYYNHGTLMNGTLWSAQTVGLQPTLTTVSPSTGPAAGGTSVTLSGTNFMTGALVRVGGQFVKKLVVVDHGTITFETPAGTAGAANVEILNPGNLTATVTGGFTYQ